MHSEIPGRFALVQPLTDIYHVKYVNTWHNWIFLTFAEHIFTILQNNGERTQEKKTDPDDVKSSKKEIAEKLREVEFFITPQAPHVVKRGLSDLRGYLGRRLTISVVDQKS